MQGEAGDWRKWAVVAVAVIAAGTLMAALTAGLWWETLVAVFRRL